MPACRIEYHGPMAARPLSDRCWNVSSTLEPTTYSFVLRVTLSLRHATYPRRFIVRVSVCRAQYVGRA